MNNLIGTLFTLTGSLILLLFGLVYLIRPKFMGYHRMAVQKDWSGLIQYLNIKIKI